MFIFCWGWVSLRRVVYFSCDGSNNAEAAYQTLFVCFVSVRGSTVGCAEVLNTTRRTWLRLVGRRHDVQLWDMDTRVPTLAYNRPYTGRGSAGESWVSAVLEPVRSRCVLAV